MATGYEVKMYSDIGRIADALGVLARRFAPEPLAQARLEEFESALFDAKRAAEGDSNDAEIEALQEVRDIAVTLIDEAKRKLR